MRVLVFLLLGLSLLSPAASAGGVEVTLGAGYRGGAASFDIEATGPLILCVTTPCILAQARTGEEFAPSLVVDVPLAGPWMIEALITELDGDLDLRSAFSPGALDRETFASSTALVGLQRRWDRGRLRPFAAGALGRTSFETSALVYEPPLFPGIAATPVDEEVLAASLAGGVLLDLAGPLAARLEARAFWHDLPERLGGTWEQTEVSAALSYRF